MSAEHKPTSSYFSDRCPKTVFGNEIATPCSLKVDHDGPCKPTPLPRQRVSSPHSEPGVAGALTPSVDDGAQSNRRVPTPDLVTMVRAGIDLSPENHGQATAALDALDGLVEQLEAMRSALEDYVRHEGATPAARAALDISGEAGALTPLADSRAQERLLRVSSPVSYPASDLPPRMREGPHLPGLGMESAWEAQNQERSQD